VVIASRIARSEETVQIVPLAAFDSTSVDMMTIVMVGSSQSRSFTRGDGRIYAYVPRGYPAKRKATA
jgi:cobalt-precorrin 5A hydrolase/precorrin-3B C17-methyltransferase